MFTSHFSAQMVFSKDIYLNAPTHTTTTHPVAALVYLPMRVTFSASLLFLPLSKKQVSKQPLGARTENSAWPVYNLYYINFSIQHLLPPPPWAAAKKLTPHLNGPSSSSSPPATFSSSPNQASSIVF